MDLGGKESVSFSNDWGSSPRVFYRHRTSLNTSVESGAVQRKEPKRDEGRENGLDPISLHKDVIICPRSPHGSASESLLCQQRRKSSPWGCVCLLFFGEPCPPALWGMRAALFPDTSPLLANNCLPALHQNLPLPSLPHKGCAPTTWRQAVPSSGRSPAKTPWSVSTAWTGIGNQQAHP